MNILDILIEEFGPPKNISLKRWNTDQKILWSKLVGKQAVPAHPTSGQDLQNFLKFAKFFNDFFVRNKKSPSLIVMAKHLDVKI